MPNDADLNDYKTTGHFISTGGLEVNAPIQHSGNLLVFGSSQFYKIQYYIVESAGTVYIRTWNNDALWKPWSVLYGSSVLTDSTIMSPLANAIGAFCGFSIGSGVKYTVTTRDYDEAPLGFAWGVSTAINRPSYTEGGIVFTFCGPHGSDTLRLQIAFDGSSIYSRRKNVNESWSSWTQI